MTCWSGQAAAASAGAAALLGGIAVAVEGPFCPVLREGPGLMEAPPAGTSADVPIGDESRFAVRWGPMTLGELRIWSEWEAGGQRAVLCARARSNRLLSAVFSLDSYYVAVADPLSFRPFYAAHHVVENGRTREEFFLFDEPAGVVRRWISSRPPLPDFPYDRDIRDAGSTIVWFRAQMAAGGLPPRFMVAAGPDLVEVEPGAAAGEERVKTPALGVVACRRFEPTVRIDGRFVRRQKYRIWLEAAPPHRLIRLAVSIPGTTLYATLQEYRRAAASAP